MSGASNPFQKFKISFTDKQRSHLFSLDGNLTVKQGVVVKMSRSIPKLNIRRTHASVRFAAIGAPRSLILSSNNKTSRLVISFAFRFPPLRFDVHI